MDREWDVAADAEAAADAGAPAGAEVDNRPTDRANGQELVRWFGDRLLWVPGLGWHAWDGRRWRPDDVRRRELMAGELADALTHRGTVQGDDVTGRRATRLESASGLDGCLRFAAPLLAREVRELDADPLLLNCPNGVLDLRTGELAGHDPRLLVTRLCPTEYDPDADDEVWRKVIHEALDGDEHRIRVVARFAGYTLTGLTTEKKFLVLHGPTNTGKSTVTEPLLHTLGDAADGGYATVWDAEVVQARSQVNRAEKLAKARAARLVLVGELEKGAQMADNFVKQFTGGDTMDAKALYRDSFSYRPQGKIIMATNYVPGSDDPALHGRLLLLPFRHVPRVRDPAVKRHLDDDEGARQAILAWAVRGCRAWLEKRDLGRAPWLEESVARYAVDSDATLQFVQDCLEAGAAPEDSATRDEVWRTYSLVWGPENVRYPLKRRIFERALEEHGKITEDVGGVRRLVGWRVRRSG